MRNKRVPTKLYECDICIVHDKKEKKYLIHILITYKFRDSNMSHLPGTNRKNMWNSRPYHFKKNQIPILWILLNIMFHATIGRSQLELIYYLTYFSTVVPFNSCVFLSCRPTVNCPSQETKETSTPIIPIKNIVLTTKGLQERTHNCWMGWRWKHR